MERPNLISPKGQLLDMATSATAVLGKILVHM